MPISRPLAGPVTTDSELTRSILSQDCDRLSVRVSDAACHERRWDLIICRQRDGWRATRLDQGLDRDAVRCEVFTHVLSVRW